MARMEFGIFLDLESETMTVDQHLDRYIPLLQDAERGGFTSVWAGETYAGPAGSFQHISSPMLVLAALSQVTGLALGTGVTLLPVWDPSRLAYDTTIMDHIARGRFSVGVGLGNPATWRQFGLDRETLGQRMDEMIRALRALWAGEPGFHGEFVHAEGPIGPRPLQPGGPPIWVGGKLKRSARRAAELGDGLIAGTHFGWEHVRSLIAEYRATLATLGKDPAAGPISVNRLLILAEDPDTAWREGGPWLDRLMRKYATAKLIPNAEAYLATTPGDLDALRAASAGVCLVGSPETVLPELETIAAEGVSQVQVRPVPYGLPTELAARTLELAARDVLPRFA